MELKYTLNMLRAAAEGFNCTFMELKWQSLPNNSLPCPCFNCTFMELKYACSALDKLMATSFNCTFMELKLELVLATLWLPEVLIVPLWNWNDGTRWISWRYSPVLIVPLWNWNTTKRPKIIGGASFNCTFMELKYDLEYKPKKEMILF